MILDEDKNIGIALSGGGIRAIGFHLGVLRSLAGKGLLEKISFISTVSGGSLCVGLIYSLSGNRWPSSEEYLKHIHPAIKKILTSMSIQRCMFIRCFAHLGKRRANILGDILEKKWGIRGNLSDISDTPRWIINGTCFETGKNWRFMSKRMGDYIFGYVMRPNFKLSHAIAASSAFPGLIGPLKIKTSCFKWGKYNQGHIEKISPPLNEINIWDGGVYENLGIEPLFKNNQIWREEIDFLIVSDASAYLGDQTVSKLSFLQRKSLIRLLDITTDQNRSLRSRSFVDYLKNNPEKGILLRLGNPCQEIFKNFGVVGEEIKNELSTIEINKAKSMGTSLKKLTKKEFHILELHGQQTNEATMHSHELKKKALVRDKFSSKHSAVKDSSLPLM